MKAIRRNYGKKRKLKNKGKKRRKRCDGSIENKHN
jgi:hypothetical protein